MSFVLNSAQQISLFDKLAFLSRRKQQMLEKSWAQTFSDHIFTRINEHIFAPLYSEKTNSRPNAPINVVVGALILKDFSGFNDEEITEACMDYEQDFYMLVICAMDRNVGQYYDTDDLEGDYVTLYRADDFFEWRAKNG